MPDNFLALLESHHTEIESLLPKYLTPERFFTLARMIERDPNLRRCSPQSLFECVLKAAQCGLEIGTVDQHAFIIPYKDEATFQPSYRGLIFRLVQAGVVSHMYADIVCKNDEVEIISGTERRFIHKPKIFGDRGPVIGAYCVATLPNGMTDFEIMELSDLDAIEKAALRISGGKPSPAWQFFKREMQKKSVIKRHAKRLQGDRRAQSDEEAARLALTFAATAREDEDADRIKLATAADNDIQTPPAKGSKKPRQVQAELVNDNQKPAPPSDASEPIDADEEALILAAAKAAKLRISALNSLLFEHFAIDDVSKITRGQVADVMKAIGG